MKSRLILLFSFCTAVAFGQYTYDYVKNPVVADSTRWNSNGSVSFSSIGVTFSGSSGGSLISAVPISVETGGGGSVNDYEVTSTLALNSGGGTYIHFFRTSSGTVAPGSGSYISAELVIPSGFSGGAAATLNVKQCVSGTVTTLGSNMIWATCVISRNRSPISSENDQRFQSGRSPSERSDAGLSDCPTK